MYLFFKTRWRVYSNRFMLQFDIEKEIDCSSNGKYIAIKIMQSNIIIVSTGTVFSIELVGECFLVVSRYSLTLFHFEDIDQVISCRK